MKLAKVSKLMQNIFDEYIKKITDKGFYPDTPSVMLFSRLAAIRLLQSDDPQEIVLAELLIKKTSVNKSEDYERLTKLAARITEWIDFEVCSLYSNSSGEFAEYNLTIKSEEIETLHYHALLKKSAGTYNFVSQTSPLIRIIGDPVLHKPGILFPEHPSKEELLELAWQIEHAKSVLIQTSGAGIAANQCAGIKNPYQFTIVGVFYDSSSHIEGVAKRYPGTKFPEARIMLNPIIINSSVETQNFNHGCLSVPCSNRCEVSSPNEITVRYQDPTNNMTSNQITLNGIDSVVLWHELTHIIGGKTYMDVTFNALDIEQLTLFESILLQEQVSRNDGNYSIPEIMVPPFHFTVKVKDGKPMVDQSALEGLLSKITNETLNGLLLQCQNSLALRGKKPIDSTSLFLSKAAFYQPIQKRSDLDDEKSKGYRHKAGQQAYSGL